MKYYLDTKFHEYRKQPKVLGLKVGKPIDTIELISIGIVSEDILESVYEIDLAKVDLGVDIHTKGKLLKLAKIHGKGIEKNTNISREYYAICKDFDLKAAWLANQGTKDEPNYWSTENVLKPIWKELEVIERGLDKDTTIFTSVSSPVSTSAVAEFNYPRLKYLINKYGKTRKQIAEEIIEFTSGFTSTALEDKLNQPGVNLQKWSIDTSPIEFYAYYADYDWVVLAWLFGRMIDLPKGFPMYCNDLKQELDMKLLNKTEWMDVTFEGNLNEKIAKIESLHKYPKQSNERNALADAKWNKELHEFINTL